MTVDTSHMERTQRSNKPNRAQQYEEVMKQAISLAHHIEKDLQAGNHVQTGQESPITCVRPRQG